MEDKLNILTEKIYSEGVQKAKLEADKITTSAKSEAEEIISNAEKKANLIIEKAKIEADNIHTNTLSEVKLASEQMISQLKTQISDLLLNTQIKEGVSNTSKESTFWGNIILTLVEQWAKSKNLAKYEFIFPKDQEKDIETLLSKELEKSLKKELKINYNNNQKEGFTINTLEKGYSIRFSSEDFETFLSEFLKPKTLQLLYGD
ncbi:MAG: hypothetical protein ACEPOV_07065 [Hyphomicrobiales bacterium]